MPVETNVVAAASSAVETNVVAAATVPVASGAVRPFRLERMVFVVEHGDSRGTGFLLQQGEKVYFLTNIHVLSGDTNFCIRNVYGETVTLPDQLEVAADRDLVRFQTDFSAGLAVAADFGFDDPICALGNSGGEGVVTRLDGKLLALGPDLVEISATIIPGNSGGPVVDASNAVVGVSTYVRNSDRYPDWLIKDSRFAKGVRRMAVRVDNVEWVPMARTNFVSETDRIDAIEEYAFEMVRIVEKICEEPDQLIFSDVEHKEIQTWIRRYNQDAKKFGGRLKRNIDGYRVSYSVSPAIEAAFRRNLDRLATLMETLEKQTTNSEVGSTSYFKKRVTTCRDYFSSCKKQMETLVDSQ